MFKKFIVVVLFMVLSVTTLPEVAKADAYEYENINELADSVASVINKKNTYIFKYKFSRSDLYLDLDVTVNWKAKTVTFNGFIFRPETVFKKEKFHAVLNLKNNKVKTASRAYKKGRNALSALIDIWNFEKDSEYTKSLGNYLLYVFAVIGKETTIDKLEDRIVLKQILEANDTIYCSTIITNKSKVLKMKVYDEDSTIKIEMK